VSSSKPAWSRLKIEILSNGLVQVLPSVPGSHVGILFDLGRNGLWNVEPGFICDLASVPEGPAEIVVPSKLGTAAGAIFHDRCYGARGLRGKQGWIREGRLSKRDADHWAEDIWQTAGRGSTPTILSPTLMLLSVKFFGRAA
jgi:hypothetical protein